MTWKKGCKVLATLTAETEADLIIKSQQGDRNAFGELVRHYYPRVVNVVYRMCGEAALAEDAAQEAFLRAWLHISSFRRGEPLRNWLYRIAVNAALDILRRRHEEPAEDETLQMIPEQSLGPEAALIEKERLALLQQAMRSLPEAARSALVLREYGELSYQEIASVLDIPIGTVMSRLSYARNRLREVLKEQILQAESEYV
ncbi:MAG: sigma-70 family RNA polymerase sigma factor [Chloroflexi bacterium]|nr:sigma-70 family RNA polymerase sigma factor [Chloroflexota bacterium]